MDGEDRGLFAGRGIPANTVLKVILLVIIAFTVGIGAGWVTTQVPGIYRDLTAPEVTPSPLQSASPIPALSVEPSPPPQITRALDEDDATAGVIDLDVPFRADETFSPVIGADEPSEDAGTVRWVRVEMEDGLVVNSVAFADFVMATLNDNRGWANDGKVTFARTEGVADVRLVIASPRTAASLCSDPEAVAASGVLVESSTEASAEDEEPTPAELISESCAAQGLIVVSLYDWAAGLEVYGDARQDARRYLLTHFAGIVLGNPDERCSGGVAEVMVDQTAMGEGCSVNPWAFPEADPSPSPEPTAGG
ncbi:DUF3152 domain-containing protein [Demequina zhanjiangensis]|uniref:DUF3152 domain-containing protein n=1 Tax=Demequina zhanjiangensis TaxID=3051659 RepID=A0ABT8FXL3_9MICO|nr:DUF3152 domain-containing protein [Demequina sp. SYSU T00b26]MDN4471645.1 DUF3152 domain-containing protein [Demequina sp. SYSU T00b26]